jgi:simple sugar transport system substrate-binding protein
MIRSAKGWALSRSRKGLTLTALAASALLALSACSGGGAPESQPQNQGGGGGGNSGYTFAMVTHETPGDTFWDRIRAGAEQAAKDTGSTLKYSADPDAAKQAVLIQNAIDSKVDGIATTLVTPDALIPTVKKAVAAGIPVDSFNSGLDYFQQAGALTHFSSDERLAGQEAGKRMKAAGATKILCTIQQAGSVALEDRCAGVKQSFPNTENLQVNGADDSAVTSAIQAKLSQDKAIDWVITLGAPQALDTLKAFEGSGSKAKVGTFDTNPDAAQAVQDGKIQFYIDQQPYLQGYMAITQLYLFKKNGNILGGGKAVLTGPSFVDSSNIAATLPFVKNNTR